MARSGAYCSAGSAPIWPWRRQRLAALVLGQPFVAAEVVFIALLGEVLEAWTFARTRRALGRLVEQTPRTARVRRDGQEVEIPAHQVAVGDRVIVGPGERIAGRRHAW